MYKLNTQQGHSFFNLQTPINYFSKKNLFQSATEIKPKRMDSYGRSNLAPRSLPKEFWFRDHPKSSRKKKKELLKIFRYLNPMYYERMEQYQHLQDYQNQVCTPSPSRKWKKCRNITLTKPSQTRMTSGIIKQKFQETLHLLIPQKYSSPKIARSQVQSPNKNNNKPSNETKNIKQFQQFDILESNHTNYVPSLLSIDRYNKENSINQSNTNNISYIQHKDISSSQITPRNKFIKDCCRLYGLDSHKIPTINKLVFQDQIPLTESYETKSDKIKMLAKSIEKSNYQQNNLLNLRRKQKELQLNQKQRLHSNSLKRIQCNVYNNSVNRVMSTYFPSLKQISKRNL
ncbi:unnamed protein product (macronuclear) [Paramecium tetraurelia]|uniref:Uncharacterized protein n=1 Tax=Paramecium tetraurelia TaxID=5888 RepID=A0BY39_PARTE|nr:uncharacterized protein GSPATT00033309001 [Paramecium tetraurelia]CAK63456.1 unnamed protein product [Paramecium tetraurelia]|eukprot:XP_001430854.1 hypothetical protein (macronuclear) [Paramecium tetraurelia strain d4-2]